MYGGIRYSDSGTIGVNRIRYSNGHNFLHNRQYITFRNYAQLHVALNNVHELKENQLKLQGDAFTQNYSYTKYIEDIIIWSLFQFNGMRCLNFRINEV